MFFLRNAPLTTGQKVEKALAGLIGGFLVMAGTVKFFDPFTTMFTSQIAYSGLPFPTLSRWAGQLGEISAGALMLLVLIRGSKMTNIVADKLMLAGTGLTMIIMTVAIYVHLNPNVPATVLPLQSKPPVMTLIVMALTAFNFYLYRRNPQQRIG
ncbi:hypothetical protein HER31_01950 [Ferrimonas lipolytica]|uniref:DoxX-like family protein n=2 Tax=Ferrimonas lipolytica TaxID=2724191 RepID=A0A6H1ULW0_9GAMM|nr:hypothetical protein HER31_01950 [Ferrimonas lipolytica]